MKKFETLASEELATVVGGRNGWKENVAEAGGAAVAGFAIGNAFCGPGCGLLGANYGPILWTGVTGFTGGFGKIHHKRRR